MKVLLTGGAGYIGSHTALRLLEQGHEPVVLDNLANASAESLRRVERITGVAVPLVVGDCADAEVLRALLAEHGPEAVIHFAGLKAVGESVAEPVRYYRTNLDTTLTLLEEMQRAGVHKLIFSSSATVYEQPGELLTEAAPAGLRTSSPYGRTKVVNESILRDAAAADPALEVALLRYFNPVGAHPSGEMGEHPHGVPNNLLPFVAQVASGRREKVRVFGDDYPTPDGTGVRDYIHVLDLADAHIAALGALRPGVLTLNVGTGEGASVWDVIHAFEAAVGRELPVEVVERRPGDAAITTADPSLAHDVLGWRATRTLADACADAWRWQSRNPHGYDD